VRRRRIDVAVVAPFAGALYDGQPVGGAELQSAYLVRSLAGVGLAVAHVVRGNARDPVDGVEIVGLGPGYDSSGIARRRAVLGGLRTANAGVYIQRSASFETGLVGVYARATGRRFAFSASSEADFRLDPAATRLAGASLDDRKSLWQYRLGVRCANAIVVQTHDQHELASRAFGVDATVIPSFCEAATPVVSTRDAFLWVGGIAEVKNPLGFVDLVGRLPAVRFRMLATGRPGAEAIAVELRRAAATLPNLELLEPRSRAEALELYGSAIALVNTSHLEGFPNTFLEAWARSTPVVSLGVDPDGVVERRALGLVGGGTLDGLAAAVTRYWNDHDAASVAGDAGKRYVEEVHAPRVVGAQWAELVRSLTEQRR
jgi:glycosyltransferase involved in cell wall biosynthesis